MAHIGQKLGLGAVGELGFLLGFAQLLFGRHLGGDVDAGAAVTLEVAIVVEDRHTTDANAKGIAVPRRKVIPEIMERPVRFQVGEMFPPLLIVQILFSHLAAGLADEVVTTESRNPKVPAREIGKPQVLVHFPKPVRRHLGEILEAFPALLERYLGFFEYRDFD